MFSKILLYIDERPESRNAVRSALRLARLCDARLFAVAVLAQSADPNPPRAAGRRRRKAPTSATEPEEQAWSRLYEIEDNAFEENVRISLLLENGSRDERLLAVMDSYQLDLLIIGAASIQDFQTLIERCPKPVLLLR